MRTDILEKKDTFRQIGIRGDCVYAIYSASTKSDLDDIFNCAILINTFQNMFQKILSANKFPTFKIGIGLGASEDLIVKTGKKGDGINDNIWIGSAVVNASKLSSEANREYNDAIVMDGTFYFNIKELKANAEHDYSFYATQRLSESLREYVYSFDMILVEFNDWIEKGMR